MKLSKISTGGEEKWLGQEPSWSSQDSMSEEQKRSALSAALNWYSYFTDTKQAKQFLLEYMQSVGRSKDEIALIRSLTDSEMNATTGKLARMMCLGYTPDENVRNRFVEQFKALLSKAKQNYTEKKEKENAATPTVVV